jgi:hypothetical protein
MRRIQAISRVRRALQPAKAVPRFSSSEAAAKFFETHDPSGIADELESIRPIPLPSEQIRKIQQRHSRRKSLTLLAPFDTITADPPDQ